MATYKRRIVYLADEEWAWLKERSASEGVTVSSLIRKMGRGIDIGLPVPPHQEIVAPTDRYDTQPVRAVPKVKK